jgi:hypothetical protein
MSPGTMIEVINAQDTAIATILTLAELGPLLDGNPQFFPHAIELFSLIAREAGHLEKLSSQLARVLLPRPHAVAGTP